MRRHELRTLNETAVRKTDPPAGGAGWQLWQDKAWQDLRDRTVELVYHGPPAKITRRTVPAPFIALSADYVGLKFDAGFEADKGLDLLVFPHHAWDSPPVASATFAVDRWPLELLLVFRRVAFAVEDGTPLAEGLLVPRAATAVAPADQTLESRRTIFAGRRHEATRVEAGVDNFYAVATRTAEVAARPGPVVFRRAHL